MGIIATILYVEKQIPTEAQAGDVSADLPVEIERLDSHNTYYSIEKMMQNYYLYARVQNKTAVYSLLEKEYTVQNSIIEENVIEKLALRDGEECQITIKEIYVKQDLNYPTYFIKANARTETNRHVYYIFYMDNGEGAFSIQPITEQQYNTYTQGIESFEIRDTQIQRNNYNRILRRTLEEEEKVTRYFEDYMQNTLYNIEEAYNSIDEEYSKKKFGSIEKYKEYINKSHQTKLDKYQINKYEGYTQYICIDTDGNYYIFNSKTSFQYTVILDNYTVDIPQFIEKYNGAKENEKILLNLEKILSATRDGDYKYVYSKLDDTFKANNFKTQIEFENYIKEKYNLEDKIKYGTYEKINDIYVYNIELINNKGTKKAQVLMQLKEGTDFVISFNFEK